MIAWEDVEGAPRTALSSTGRELVGWKVEGIIYAPSIEDARARLRGADIYLDHARVLDDYDGAPLGGDGEPRPLPEPVLRWESALHDDEPRDQHADQYIYDHGYWDCGPADTGAWTVTLVRQDENLDIVQEFTWHGRDEKRVKDIAAYVEDGVRRLRLVHGGKPAAAMHIMVDEWIKSTLWLPA